MSGFLSSKGGSTLVFLTLGGIIWYGVHTMVHDLGFIPALLVLILFWMPRGN